MGSIIGTFQTNCKRDLRHLGFTRGRPLRGTEGATGSASKWNDTIATIGAPTSGTTRAMRSSRDGTHGRSQTINDVALAAGVSKSTVSLVLQGSSLIRHETAERVRAAARDLGYVYNRRAAELRGQSSRTIDVVINDLMNPFFAEVLVGIERKLVDAGYVVLMAHTHESLSRQHQVLASMREQNAAGIVLRPPPGTPKSQVN